VSARRRACPRRRRTRRRGRARPAWSNSRRPHHHATARELGQCKEQALTIGSESGHFGHQIAYQQDHRVPGWYGRKRELG
jgi:hypothetical protein